MSVSGINFSGLSTGIDTESIIEQLLKLETRPITVLQARQKQIQQQQVALGQISAAVSGLQAAAASLDGPSSFGLTTTSSSDSSVATVTSQTGALTGTHQLQVLQLAQAQRVSSSDQASQAAALGLSGQILVNGKAVSIGAGDSLQAIAASINNAKAGASAAVVAIDSSTYRLVISSDTSGADNTVSIADVGSGVIARTGLDLIGATKTVHHPLTSGAATGLFADNATSVATLIGLTAPASGTIQIDGVDVAIDLGTDSLMAIASKINVAGIPGVSAAVVNADDPVTGASLQRIEITGAAQPTFTDDQNILSALGVLKNAVSHQIAAAQDSQFVLDGLTLTRSTNTVSDAISGITLTLLKDTADPSTTIAINTDVQAIKSNIGAFVSAFNQLRTTHQQVASFDAQTLVSGPLFGDTTVQSLVDSLTDSITGAVPGLPTATTALSQIGITLDQAGMLSVNDAALTNALNSRLLDVARLFQATGSNIDTRVTFVTSTDKSRSSGPAGYAIDVTAVATRGTMTAGLAHTADDNPDTEVITFTGGQFGEQGRGVTIAPNSTLDAIVAQINAHTYVSQYVLAAKTGNQLTLTAKQYGTPGSFQVSSSQIAAANNSGIGPDSVAATGVDVAGTLNGEAATGRGQFLTGNSGNANTDGIQVRIDTLTIGSHGSLIFAKGVANLVKNLAASSTDFLNGSLPSLSNDMTTQISDLQTEITELQERLSSRETYLRQQFSAMEAAVARIRAASAGLASLGLTTTSSSSTSS